jgi:hypothetical protein
MPKRSTNKARRKAARYTYPGDIGSARNTLGGFAAKQAHSDAAYAHALVNPFSDEARGVKCPDDDSSRSVAFQLKWRSDLASDGSGVAGVAYNPILSAMRNKAATLTAASIPTWGSDGRSSDFTAINSAFASYRIVSWGIRIIPLMAPTDQSGYIRIITTSERPSNNTPFVTDGGFFEEVEDFPVANSEVHWVAKPVGNTYKEYVAVSSSAASWEYVVVSIHGAQPNADFIIEVVYNVEAQVKLESISGAIATPAADHAPRVLAAADHARNRVKNSHPSAPSLLSSLWGAAKKGLIAAAHTYGTPLIGMAAQALLGKKYRPQSRLADRTPLIVD